MADEVDIECPGCNAVFGVPVELCGEMAQCAECETVFEIPSLDEEGADGNLTSTDTGAIKGIEADGDATNTVRLSRTGIGMIPQIKDDFTLGAPPSSAKPPPGPSAPAPPKKQFTKHSPAKPATPPSSSRETRAAAPPPEAPSKPAKKIPVPAWTKVRLKKGEDVYGVREVSKSPMGAAVVAFIFALCAGGAGIALKDNMAMAAVGVVASAAIGFIVVFLISKSGAKKALVLTSQRAVCVVGGERLEVKK
jgi:hypothetical protein